MEDTSDINSVGYSHPNLSDPAPAAGATDPVVPATPAASADTTSPADKGPTPPSTEDTDDDEAPRPGESPQQTAARTRSRLQKRIDKLTGERYTATGEAKAAREEVARLRAELDAARGTRRPSSEPTSGGDAEPDDQTPPAEPLSATASIEAAYAQKHPEPVDNDFDTYSDYVKAYAKWFAGQQEFVRDQVVQLEHRQKAEQQHYEQVQARTAAFKEKTPDFDAKLATLDIPIHRRVMAELERLDHGAAIIYSLANDKAEAEKFARLHPADQLIHIGRLDARLESKSAPLPAGATLPRKPPVSRAPEPLPTQGGGSNVGHRSEDQMTADERMDLAAKRLRGDQ